MKSFLPFKLYIAIVTSGAPSREPKNHEKTNLINFLCEEVDTELSVDYLFHVLDSEISYPIDDEKVKSLFEDDRMRKLKDVMMEKLQDDEVGEVSSEEEDV